MNNKGFMSVTMIYSFFLVFLMILLLMMSESVSEKISLNKIKNSIKNDMAEVTLSEYIQSLYTGTQGENNLYFHDASLTDGAEDNSYRYSGASSEVNNYVCLIATSPCPDNYLYRIIGVFDNKTKVIKATYGRSDLLGSYITDGVDAYEEDFYPYDHWNDGLWSESPTNEVILNTNFLNNIPASLSNKIALNSWQIGLNTEANIRQASAKNVYEKEIHNPPKSTTISSKVALMYASDYAYAGSKSNWAKYLGSYSSYATSNWLFTKEKEYILTAIWSPVFYINEYGSVVTMGNSAAPARIRPCFYLEKTVFYTGGTGTQSDPIRIN